MIDKNKANPNQFSADSVLFNSFCLSLLILNILKFHSVLNSNRRLLVFLTGTQLICDTIYEKII